MKRLSLPLLLILLVFIGQAQAAQTVILAPGHTSATSSGITITDHGVITAFTLNGKMPAVQIPVYRQTSTGTVLVGYLKQDIPWYNAEQPGVYTAVRPAIGTYNTPYDRDVGIAADPSVGSTTAVTQGTSPWVVSAASLPLPTGASTSALQTTGNTSLASIATNTTGASTAANQTTANTSLSTIATNTTGAATAAKQPSLGTAGTASSNVITVQGIASMTALKTDGSAVTQPISAASLPLPSGAATSANQPGFGTAGSANANVLTVQGIANGTPIPTAAQATTTGGWSSAYSGNVTNTAVAVDASPGAIGGFTAYNSNTTVCYLQFWNTAQGSVTVGTTAPYRSIGIPAFGGAIVAHPQGIVFTTAITVAATTTRAGGTACTSGLDITIDYK